MPQSVSPDILPRRSRGLKPSLPAIVVVLAILVLTGIWAVNMYRDVVTQERLVRELRMDTAEALIHSMEATARSTVFGLGAGPGAAGLVEELATHPQIAYVIVMDSHGRLVAAAGSFRGETINLRIGDILKAGNKAGNRINRDAEGVPVFEVGRRFHPIEVAGPISETILRRYALWCGYRSLPDLTALQEQAAFVGLYTEEIDKARRTDLIRNAGQGVLLLFLGSIALYLLFVTHGSRVARDTLNTMELYTRNVIDSMPAGLLTLDADGLVVSHNARALEMLGIQTAQPEGQDLVQLMGAGGRELMAALGDLAEILEAPVECHRLDGQVVPLKVSASRLTDREEQPLGTVLILRDLREIRAMEEQLERSRRHAALGQMAAGIAHEIRNPLGTLRGFAQYFAKRSQDDPTADEFARMMIGEVDRLNRSISALLQYARPRAPELQRVDLAALLRRTARFLDTDLQEHHIDFRLEVPEAQLALCADPDLLTQVLLNLLQNAIAACEDGGEMLLAATDLGDEIQMLVRDSGSGIAADDLPRIFDPFFTTRKTGTGLGLAVVHQIIEQHGARIEVDSAPGRGTCFIIHFPQEELRGLA